MTNKMLKPEDLEKVLKKGAANKTVTDVLRGLEGRASVSLMELSHFRRYDPRDADHFELVAVYKDGMALNDLPMVRPGRASSDHYLHRNHEAFVYRINRVEGKDQEVELQ
jgi:hypothetical protein